MAHEMRAIVRLSMPVKNLDVAAITRADTLMREVIEAVRSSASDDLKVEIEFPKLVGVREKA